MKKILSVLLSVCVLIVTPMTAFASINVSDDELISIATQAYTQRYNDSTQIVSAKIVEVDEFKVCQMILSDKQSKSSGTKTGHAVHSWFDSYDNFLGSVEIAADFDYSSSGTTVSGGDHWASSSMTDATYTVTSETSKDSSALNRAYYKITYRFEYGNAQKTKTLEVSCSNSGTLYDNGGTYEI